MVKKTDKNKQEGINLSRQVVSQQHYQSLQGGKKNANTE